MKIRVLGSHNLETRSTRHTCFLVNDALAIDAGSLVTALDDTEIAGLRTILLTHHHFDHTRDLPTLGLLRLAAPHAIDVHGLPITLQQVTAHLMDGEVYPDFTKERGGDGPRYRFSAVAPDRELALGRLTVAPVPMPHSVPSVGYVLKVDDDAIAFTGDTGGGLLAMLTSGVTPRVLFVDMTFPNRMLDAGKVSGHLTPRLLHQQLEGALSEGTPVPPIVAVHRGVGFEDELLAELAQVSRDIGVDIEPGYEGMTL
ncbi:MAG: MBL fold metallo-hydrolase [Dehalococcoidia bacterium]